MQTWYPVLIHPVLVHKYLFTIWDDCEGGFDISTSVTGQPVETLNWRQNPVVIDVAEPWRANELSHNTTVRGSANKLLEIATKGPYMYVASSR